MVGVQAVLHVVDRLAGVVLHGVPIGLQDALPVLLVDQAGPGLQLVGEVLRVLVAQHGPEYIRPGAGGDFPVLVEIHGPVPGAHGGVDHLHGGLLLLDLGVGLPDLVPVGLLLGQQQGGALSGLEDDEHGHRQHGDDGDGDLYNAPEHQAGADGADLLSDDIVSNQDGQHPVAALHRDVAQVPVDILVVEGDMAPAAAGEIAPGLLIAVPGGQLRLRQGGQEVVSYV